ncbi:MAG: SH3 domain-containing protein [Anaerolineae bacterium]|nr:SH3 domain-containing protein [Anaerolineae bacterium]
MVGRRVGLVIVLLVISTLACNMGTASDNTSDAGDAVEFPLVLLVAPVNSSEYAEGAEVALHAIALDSLAGVARIEFRVNDFPVGEVLAGQPEGQPSLDAVVMWQAAGPTGHLITAEAFRPDGSSLGLDDVTVRVIGRSNSESAPGANGAPPQATAIPTPTIPLPADLLSPDDGPVAWVISNTPLNVRQGPSQEYAAIGTLAPGSEVRIIGRNVDSSWWAIEYADETAWIFANLTDTEGDLSQLPLIDAP